MLTFHVTVHGSCGERAGPLGATFDDALEAIRGLNRMFIEPDGSFVWTGQAADGTRWQVDGNLVDRGPSLAYVELKGQCPEAELNTLLSSLGWPEEGLAFQLVKRGTLLSEPDFRQLAATIGGAH